MENEEIYEVDRDFFDMKQTPDNIDLMLEGTDKEIYDLNKLREQHIREIERIDNKIEKLCLTQMEK